MKKFIITLLLIVSMTVPSISEAQIQRYDWVEHTTYELYQTGPQNGWYLVTGYAFNNWYSTAPNERIEANLYTISCFPPISYGNAESRVLDYPELFFQWQTPTMVIAVHYGYTVHLVCDGEVASITVH